MNHTFEPKRLTSYSDSEILIEIKRILSKYFGNEPCKIKDFNKYGRVKANTIIRRFGSWSNAMKRAGFVYKRRVIDTAYLLKDLERVKNLNHGKYFTQKYYLSNGGKYSPETLIKRLGYLTWPSLLEGVLSTRKIFKVIEIQKAESKPISKKQLFMEMKRVWDSLGKRPSYSEFRSQGTIGTKVYERRFGTWQNAIQEFCSEYGYNKQGRKGLRATKKILLDELQEIVFQLPSNTLDYQTYKKRGGTYSIGTFQNHFGSWNSAVAAIGKKDGYKIRTEEDLFSEIQRLWEMFGRQPTSRELRQQGNISLNVFQRKYGSWIKAIHAFCQDRENTVEERFNKSKNISNNSQFSKTDQFQVKSENATQINKEKLIIMRTPRHPSPRLRFRVLSRDKFACVKCGRSPKADGIKLHVDHCIPYSKGGETIFENLETLCEICNIGKGNIIFES